MNRDGTFNQTDFTAPIAASEQHSMDIEGTFVRRFDRLVKKTRSSLARFRTDAPIQGKKHRILSGPSRGLTIVTSWRNYHTGIIGTTEPELVSWLEKNVRARETWLDIGANYGYISLVLRRKVGPQGRVFAFEPKLDTCGCLSQTMALNGFSEVTVIPMGLGMADGIEVKTLAVNGGMVQSLSRAGRTETIAVSRLDWLWPRICGDRKSIDGVKMDVQGMELDVLEGMRSLLAAHKPRLILEVHEGISRRAILELLTSCGYDPSGKPISKDKPISKSKDPANNELYHDNWSYLFLPKDNASA